MKTYGSIDEEYGLPLEEISCPGCGRSYKRQRTVCRNCQECKSCCKKHPCDAPHYVPACVVIEVDVLGWVSPLSDGESWSESVIKWMAEHPQEKTKGRTNMPPANITQFLTQEAFMKFRTITWLAKRAKEIGFLSDKEPQYKFVEMLERWMAKYPDGTMTNGCIWQAEVYFAGHGRLKAKRPGHNQGSIGLIRVVRRKEE